jgi:hypothetical protein
MAKQIFFAAYTATSDRLHSISDFRHFITTTIRGICHSPTLRVSLPYDQTFSFDHFGDYSCENLSQMLV